MDRIEIKIKQTYITAPSMKIRIYTF